MSKMQIHWNFGNRTIEVKNMAVLRNILDDEFPAECGGWKMVGNKIFDGETGEEEAQIVY